MHGIAALQELIQLFESQKTHISMSLMTIIT